MDKDYLTLKRASASRPSGEWNDDDYDVLADGVVVGRLFKVSAAPVGTPWMWTLEIEHCGDRRPTYGYAATREAAMAAFKSWRRDIGMIEVARVRITEAGRKALREARA
jgi:hypothetical protein